MYNTGTNIALSVASGGSSVYSYVWDFWDGTSQATTLPETIKLINIGGNLLNNQLHYSCQAVGVDGSITVTSGTIVANNPPVILPGVSVVNNDSYFPYTGTIKLSALDLENNAITFAWYEGANALGSGITTSAGTASSTWVGNGTTVTVSRPIYQNTFAVNVPLERNLTCYVKDNAGGTVALDFTMRGQPAPLPDTSISTAIKSVAFDASTLPIAIIGNGQFVSFSVFAAPLPNNVLSFAWRYSGSNNWTVPSTDSGVSVLFDNGGVQNISVKDISSELISSGLSKEVTAQVRVTATNTQTAFTTYVDLETSATLVGNGAPSSVTINRYLSTGTVPISGNGPVSAGSKLVFTAVGVDPNDELLTYEWNFSLPDASNVANAYGPQVVYDTTGMTSGVPVTGQLTVANRLNATLSATIPAVLIS